jgi:hypothetical protein
MGTIRESIKMTLHPAAEPVPSLKFRLLPTRLEQKPGNAAVHYGKVKAEENLFFANREHRENINRWQETPLEELRQAPVNLRSSGGIEYSLRQGAMCRYCDWQLPIGTEPFREILLSDAQEARAFGRILAARARLQLAQGQFTEAIDTLKTGYALARHVASGETLVNGLVGIAICGSISRQLLELIQLPGAPNLYWALTSLPRPLFEMRDALEVEAYGVELTYPELQYAASSSHTPIAWRDVFHRVAIDAFKRMAEGKTARPSIEDIDRLVEQWLPRAKQALLERGASSELIADASMQQIVLMYSLQIYHDVVDDALKHFHGPFPQAIAAITSARDRAASQEVEMIPLARRLIGAVWTARTACARIDREFAFMRLLEALRLFAANHDGALPDDLAQVHQTPMPIDPVTEQPFQYRRMENTAYVNGPELRDLPLNYEITVCQPCLT